MKLSKMLVIWVAFILYLNNLSIQAQQAQAPTNQEVKDLRTYLTSIKTDVNQGKKKFTLLDLNQIKSYLKYVPIPMQDKISNLDLSNISVWWSNEEGLGGISGKANLIGQPVEVRIMMGYNIKDKAPTIAEIQKAQTEIETAVPEVKPEEQAGTAGATSTDAASAAVEQSGVASRGKDVLGKLQLGVIIGLPAGFKFGGLMPELKVIDDHISISKGAISLTEAQFTDPTFGAIGEGLNLVLSISQNLEPFKWMIDFINKSKSPIKLEGTTIDLRGNISPEIGGSQFLIQLPGVISLQMGGRKLVESDRPSMGIVLLPSKVPGVAGVGGIRIGIIGGMKIFVPKMDPLDFTMELAFDSSAQATITGQMKGLLDLGPYGLPFGFGGVGTAIGFNPENVETLGLSTVALQGKTVIGPTNRRIMLSAFIDLVLSGDQTNVVVNGCLVPEVAGSCLGPEGANVSTEAISVTDVVYLVIEFLNKSGVNIKFDEFKSTIPDLALKQAEFYFSPQGVYVFDKMYPQGFRISGATEIFGVSAGLNFWGSKEGFDAKGYLSTVRLGDYVLLTGAGPDKKYGTADDGAFVNAVYKPKSTINLGLTGDIEIKADKLGTIKGQADVDVSTSGVNINLETKIFDQFDSIIKLDAPNFKNPTAWHFLGQFSQKALDSLTDQLKTAFQNLKAPLANLTAQAQKQLDDAQKAYDFATANIQKRISDAQNQVNSLKSKINTTAAACPLISATTTTDIKQAQATVTQKFGADYAPLVTKAADQIELIATDIDKAKQTLAPDVLERFNVKRWVDAFSSALKAANLKPADLTALNIWLRQFMQKGTPPSSAVNQSFLSTLGLVFAAQSNLGDVIFSQGTLYYPSFLQRAIELTSGDPDIVAVTNIIAQAQYDKKLTKDEINNLRTDNFTNKFKEIYDRIKPTHLERSNTLYFITFPSVFDFIRGHGEIANTGKGILEGTALEIYRSFVALWSAGYDLMLGDEYNLKADYRYFPAPANWPNNIIENAKELAKNYYIIRSQENNPGVNARLNNQVKLGTFILLAKDFLGYNNFKPFLNNVAEYAATNVFVTNQECSTLGPLCSNNKVTSKLYNYDDFKKIILAYMNYVQTQTGPVAENSPDVKAAWFLFPVPETITASTVSMRANLIDGLKYWLASGPKNFALFILNYHTLPLVNAWKLQWNLEPLVAAYGISMTSGGTQPNMPALIKEKEFLVGFYNTISGNKSLLKNEKVPWPASYIKTYGQP